MVISGKGSESFTRSAIADYCRMPFILGADIDAGCFFYHIVKCSVLICNHEINTFKHAGGTKTSEIPNFLEVHVPDKKPRLLVVVIFYGTRCRSSGSYCRSEACEPGGMISENSSTTEPLRRRSLTVSYHGNA